MPKLTYVLVHDIGSGAWVWKKVIRSLISRGHDAIALDLKASGDNPTNIKDVKDLMDYAEPLLDYLARQRSQVILVAHGYGGVSATLAMKLHPTKISSVIYLNAFMPNDKGDPNPNLKEVTSVLLRRTIVFFFFFSFLGKITAYI